MMIHPGFIRREIARSSKQAVVFILCVGLSLVTLTAFGGFSKSIHQSLLHDARKLHAADIVIRSYETLSEPLSRAISENVQEGRVALARYHEFYSVIRTDDDSTSVLSQLKVVEKGYPFYGEVLLQSGRPLHEVLTSGRTVVAPTLLDRLGLRLGDTIQVGYTSLTIQDVVLAEPDRPISLFSFGPRVFIAAEDLDALGLLQTGSRIRHVHLLKVKDGAQTDALAQRLSQIADLEREQVDTFQTARSRIKRFFERFMFFLNLVGIFILVVSGVGIQSTLTALLNEKQYAIAIMKALGAGNRHILVHYMIIVMLLGGIGMGAGILIGILIQYGLAHLLSAFLPPGTPFLDRMVRYGGKCGFGPAGGTDFLLCASLPVERHASGHGFTQGCPGVDPSVACICMLRDVCPVFLRAGVPAHAGCPFRALFCGRFGGSDHDNNDRYLWNAQGIKTYAYPGTWLFARLSKACFEKGAQHKQSWYR